MFAISATMADKALRQTNDYQTHFDPKAYLKQRFSTKDGVLEDKGFQSLHPFFMESHHAFYTKYHRNWDGETARVVEYGGGPVVYYLSSAVPYVREVVFAEYLESCRAEVQRWKDDEPTAHDWTPYFRYIVNTLEGTPGDEAVQQRQDNLRRRITTVIPADISRSYPLLSPLEPFDILSSNLVLGSVSNTVQEFEANVIKLSQLLKVGGYFILLVSLERTWAWAGDQKFFLLYLTSEDVHRSIENAGFTIVEAHKKRIPDSAGDVYGDCKYMEFVVAQKLK